MAALHTLVLFAFVGIMAWAAYGDVRRLEISNAIPLALLALYPIFLLTAAVNSDLGVSAAIAALAFAVGALLFAGGMLGGGDVKLFAVAVLWIGPMGFATFLILTVMVGGALGIALLIPPIAERVAGLREPKNRFRDVGPKFRHPMPYGVAIAVAASIMLHPHFI